MITFLTLFHLMSAPAFAQSPSQCATDTPSDKVGQLKNISEHLEWWAASNQQILNSPCAKTKPYTNEEMLAWIAARPSPEKKVNAKFYGLELTNEDPKLVSALKDLLTARDWFGDADIKKQKQFKSACKTAICAAQEIFGKREGVQLLFLHERYGYNGSSHQENASAWKASELDDVLLGLSTYPASALPIDSNSRLVHFSRGKGYAWDVNGTTVANASIELFDNWNTLPSSTKRSTIVHEMGHRFASKMGADESPTWLEMSGWISKTNPKTKEVEWKSSKPAALVSEYGKTNPAEDFAECVVAYRFNPKLLQKTSPEKYAFLKATIFDGLEYTSSDSCDPKNSISKQRAAKVQSRAIELVGSPTLLADSPELKIVEKKCADSMFAVTLKASGENKTAYNKCVTASLGQAICSNVASSSKELYASFQGSLIKNQSGNCPLASQIATQSFISKTRQQLKESFMIGLKGSVEDNSYTQNDCKSWSVGFAIKYGYPDGDHRTDLKSLDARFLSIQNGDKTTTTIKTIAASVCDQVNKNRSLISRKWDAVFSTEELQTALDQVIP